ncbi:hypothetical protein D3C87_2175530 [compost metagenome]
MPYLSIIMGEPEAPDPSGCSCPVQTEPDLNKILSPGKKVVLFTLVNDCHAAPVLKPLLLSLPAAEST